MHDGRAPTLQQQALDAIHDHTQNAVQPTPAELDAIAQFQRTDPQFFFNFTESQDPVGSRSLGGFIMLTDDDVDDIVAYLKLLGPNRKK